MSRFKDRDKLYQAYQTIMSMALTWAIILVINQYFSLRILIAVSALYSLIPAVLIFLFDINRKNAISYFLLVGIIPVLAFVFWITGTNPITWFMDIINWCNIYNGSKELYAAGYANIIVFGAACLTAIIFYLLTKKQITKVLLAVTALVALIILCIEKIDISKVVVCIGVFYIMTILVELYGIVKVRKVGRHEKKEGILYLAPICLLLAVLAIAMPSKPEPIQWRAFKQIYHSLSDQIDVWGTDLDYYFGKSKGVFSVSMTGYSEDNGKLVNKNKLLKSNKLALKLSGLSKGNSVYLIGSVSDVYTGTSWKKSKTDYLSDNGDYLLDYIEMFYALSRQNKDVLESNRFIDRKAIKLTYDKIKTKTFFYPDKMSSFDTFSNSNKLSTQTAQINFKKARGNGTSYQTTYYEMNLQGDAFMQMLKDADTFSYQNSQKIDQDTEHYLQFYLLSNDNVVNFKLEDYLKVLGERADRIKAEYTALPDELPDRVYNLADQITAGSKTKYEKLKAIETYLVQNYTYSLDPQKLPKGADFIDNFLFETKTGYCTSFATAMVILSRCVGIPTRYVEGYVVRCDEADSEGNYLIRNSSAHAWAEAYIEGVGWIPFEATAPFYNARYTVWKDLPKAGNESDTLFFNERDFQHQDTQSNQPLIIPKVEKKDNTTEVFAGIVIFILVLFILLAILIIYYFVLKYRYKKEYQKADYSRRMYMQFLRILRLLKREGFTLGQQETILMLSDRVKDNFRYRKITFLDVANIFMRYRYAQAEVTKDELDKVSLYHDNLVLKEKEEVSRFKVWLGELLFLSKRGLY